MRKVRHIYAIINIYYALCYWYCANFVTNTKDLCRYVLYFVGHMANGQADNLGNLLESRHVYPSKLYSSMDMATSNPPGPHCPNSVGVYMADHSQFYHIWHLLWNNSYAFSQGTCMRYIENSGLLIDIIAIEPWHFVYMAAATIHAV